jgi:hypothetical protein
MLTRSLMYFRTPVSLRQPSPELNGEGAHRCGEAFCRDQVTALLSGGEWGVVLRAVLLSR